MCSFSGERELAKCIQPGLLQESLGEGKARCLTCERRCILGPGDSGWCRTRRNIGGVIHTLIYGAVSSLSANPIEKKPLYHFYPGSIALTAGSWSCNFACPWCQNWHISKSPGRQEGYMSPESFIIACERSDCSGTSISFNEPTLSLEWACDVFRLAHRRGLYNTFVSNGYMTQEALEVLIAAGLDAINVDIKGDAATVHTYCGGVNVEFVWRNCRTLRAAGIHLEITTLIVPGVNDRAEVLEQIAQRIASELGQDVPWHVTAYYPAYRFSAPPTPLATLEQALRIGRQAGLSYVYIGNVPDHPAQHTYCPRCAHLLIRRSGLQVTGISLVRGCCPHCGHSIAGKGWPEGQTH